MMSRVNAYITAGMSEFSAVFILLHKQENNNKNRFKQRSTYTEPFEISLAQSCGVMAVRCSPCLTS